MNASSIRLIALPALMALAVVTAQAQTTPEAHGAGANTSVGRLDLKLGDVRTLFTPEQLRVAMNLDAAGQPNVVMPEELDTVIVKGESGPTRGVPMGFAAMFWGAQHPSQIWRLFTPIAAGETFGD